MRTNHAKRGWVAAPSALMGLVTFSFVLLAFGGAVYTAVLPSMTSASVRYGTAAQGADLGLVGPESPGLAAALAGVPGLGPAGEGDSAAGAAQLASSLGVFSSADGSAAEGASGADGATGAAVPGLAAVRAPQASASASSSEAGGSSTGAGDASGGSAAAGEAGSGAQSGGSSSGSSSGGSSSGGGAASGGSGNGGAASGGQGGGKKDDSGSSAADAEVDARSHEFLLAKLDELNGYLARVNACVEDFNADCVSGDMSARQSHHYAVEDLMDEIMDCYVSISRAPIASRGTKWASNYSVLVALARCSYQYLGHFDNAWEVNLRYEEPSAHVDEFMAQLDGAQACMDEYSSWAAQVNL